MPAQFDFQSGLDPTPLNEVSGAQLLQMVNQITPLSNIGGILFSTTEPTQTEVEVDNPRWVRYMLLHYSGAGAPTPKFWNQTTHAWTAISVANASIANAQLNGFVVGVLTNLTRTGDDSADVGSAKLILRIDSAGKRVELKSIDAILDEEKVDIDQHNLVGVADNKFIVKRSGSAEWGTISPATDISDGAISLVKLNASAGASRLMATDAAGVLGLLAVADAILINSINLSKLGDGENLASPSEGQVVTHRGGSGKVWETPKLSRELVFSLTNTEQVAGTLTAGKLPTATNTAVWQVAHGLTALPKYVQVRIVCLITDGAFAVGDEIDITSVQRFNTANGEYRACHMLKVSSSVVRLSINNGATSLVVWDNGGGASTIHTLTPANWGVKVITHN